MIYHRDHASGKKMSSMTVVNRDQNSGIIMNTGHYMQVNLKLVIKKPFNSFAHSAPHSKHNPICGQNLNYFEPRASRVSYNLRLHNNNRNQTKFLHKSIKRSRWDWISRNTREKNEITNNNTDLIR